MGKLFMQVFNNYLGKKKKISLSAIRKLQLPLIKNSKQLIISKKLDVSTNNSRNQYISKVRVLKCQMQI